MHFSSIRPIDTTLSSATTPGQSGPGSDSKEWVHSPKLHYDWNLTIRLFSVISRTIVEEGFLLFCRGAVGVFFSSSRLGRKTLVRRVLLLCRDAVGVFYSPSRLGHRTLVGGFLPLCRGEVGVFYTPQPNGQLTDVCLFLWLLRI